MFIPKDIEDKKALLFMEVKFYFHYLIKNRHAKMERWKLLPKFLENTILMSKL